MRACNRKLGDQVRMGNYYSSMRIDSFLVSVRVDGLGEKLVFLLRFVCAQIVRLSIYEFFSAKFSIVHSALWVKWACVRPSAWNYRVIHGAMSIWYGSFKKKTGRKFADVFQLPTFWLQVNILFRSVPFCAILQCRFAYRSHTILWSSGRNFEESSSHTTWMGLTNLGSRSYLNAFLIRSYFVQSNKLNGASQVLLYP
jgi:hypothetical protein